MAHTHTHTYKLMCSYFKQVHKSISWLWFLFCSLVFFSLNNSLRSRSKCAKARIFHFDGRNNELFTSIQQVPRCIKMHDNSKICIYIAFQLSVCWSAQIYSEESLCIDMLFIFILFEWNMSGVNGVSSARETQTHIESSFSFIDYFVAIFLLYIFDSHKNQSQTRTHTLVHSYSVGFFFFILCSFIPSTVIALKWKLCDKSTNKKSFDCQANNGEAFKCRSQW